MDKERHPCPECGKEVTWTQAGKPRAHKCEPKANVPLPQEQPPAAPAGTVTPEMVMKAYISTRDAIGTLTKKYDELKAKLKEKQEKREAWLLTQMTNMGTTQLKNAAGISYIGYTTSVKVADRVAFFDWLREDWEAREAFLPSSAAKGEVTRLLETIEESIKQLRELYGDEIPAEELAKVPAPPKGIEVTRIRGAKVRKA